MFRKKESTSIARPQGKAEDNRTIELIMTEDKLGLISIPEKLKIPNKECLVVRHEGTKINRF